MKEQILVLYADRAERSILDPVVDELKQRDIAYNYLNLSKKIPEIHDDKNLSQIYDYIYKLVERENFTASLVIGDRREIMFASLALFIKGIPIIQLASGDLSSEMSLVDDYFRHLITIMSSKQIAFSGNSLNKTKNILQELNIKPVSTFYPNPTFSNIEFEKISIPTNENYDLILMHPQSLSREGTIEDQNQLLKLIDLNKKNVIIRGNKDKNYEIWYELWDKFGQLENFSVYNNLKKEEFIALLKNADRFISNSSCSYYEAPIFLDEKNITRIGRRNRNREIINYTKKELKSAPKIVDFILKNVYN